MTFLTCKLTL